MPISSALLDMATLDSLMSLGAPLPNNHERVLIPSGTPGTAATINRMQDLVASGKRHFPFREFVGSLVRDCPKKDYSCYMQTCFNYCRDKIQYVYDPVGVELIESPWKIIPELGGSGIADCDSICVVVASMAEAMGFPARFVTIKADRGRPDDFSHVFTEVKIPGKGWMGADATMPHEFGWSPEGYPLQNWPATKDSEDQGHDESVMGMGSAGMYGMADFIDEGEASDSHAIDMYAPLDYGPAVSVRPNANVKYTVRPMMHGLGESLPLVRPLAHRHGNQGRHRGWGKHRNKRRRGWNNSSVHISKKPFITMHGLGATGADYGVIEILERVYNGTMEQELRGKWAQVLAQLSVINDARNKAIKLSEPARSKILALVTAARNQALAASMQLTDAKNKYDGIVDILAGIPGVNAPSKFTLNGLGFLPPAVASFAVTGTVLAGLVVALGFAMSQAGGMIHGGEGYIQQIANAFAALGVAIQQTGGAFSQVGGTVADIGWLVLVGLAGYVGYEYLKKKGHVGGARA
jgi:hypothetical protein